MTLTSSSDDSSSLLSAFAAFLAGTAFFWMDPFLTGLTSSSESDESSLDSTFFTTAFCFSSFFGCF